MRFLASPDAVMTSEKYAAPRRAPGGVLARTSVSWPGAPRLPRPPREPPLGAAMRVPSVLLLAAVVSAVHGGFDPVSDLFRQGNTDYGAFPCAQFLF